MKATAKAPANIAFIKYWGKEDEQLRLPLNASFSMNLSGAYTITTVEFSSEVPRDLVKLEGGFFSEEEEARVVHSIEHIRKEAGILEHAKVVTKNTFPKGAGAAASASGFAALTVAGFAAAGKKLSKKELTAFARMGSGSACRSIPDGFVVWNKGESSEDSYAYSLYPPEYWDLRDVLVIVDFHMKKVSTTQGQEGVKTSPFWKERVRAVPGKMSDMFAIFKEKNFKKFGELIEEDCLNMHHVMQTQKPPLMYWNDQTRQLMDVVRTWRSEGLPVYFTIDAGPNVHLMCEAKDEKRVIERAKAINGVEQIIVNAPAVGTRLVEDHLF